MGVRGSFSGNWREFVDCRVRLSVYRGSETAREGVSTVFIHGRYGESSHWEPVLDRLEGAARCYCIDLPGFGDSYAFHRPGVSLLRGARLLHDIVSELAARGPVVLVGHDIGGTIALMSSIRLASCLEGLILIGPACLTCPPSGMRPGFLARRRLRERVRIDRVKLGALRELEETWPHHYERLAWKRAFASMERPTLLLWGARDEVAPDTFGAELLTRLPNAELLEHPLGSHWLISEDPTWIALKIREFLFRLGGGITARRSLWR